MRKTAIIAIMALCSSLGAMAQETPLLKKGANMLDSIAKKRVDPHYIEVPKLPWRVMLTGTLTNMSLKMNSDYYDDESDVRGSETTATTGVDYSTGMRVGYRTLSATYGVKWGHINGTVFSVGTNGNRFGFNVKLRTFKEDVMKMRDYWTQIYDFTITEHLDDPMKIRSLMIDGYYVLNNRHYSNGATHAMAFIQRRSAGSFILGASYVDAEVDYATDDNVLFVSAMMNGVGKIRMRQINLRAGYGYNWVPAKDWVLNLTLMPQMSLDNKLSLCEALK